MIIRALDSDGDWTFGKGKSNYRTGLDAIQANIRTRLREWKGDCFYSTASGVDYNNLLDVGTETLLNNDIKRVILQSDGVVKITSYISDFDRIYRTLTVSCEVQTIYGKTFIEEIPKETVPGNEFVVETKITPDDFTKLTPDGFVKIIFVRRA
jgi:hypothetical protein